MAIELLGPAWPSKLKLEALLKDAPGDLRVCYGASNVPGALNGGPRLNSIEQLKAFQKDGVSCPEWTTDVNIARAWLKEGFLVFGRKLYHTQGRDIVGPSHKRWATSDWWVKVIASIAHEWRQHVFRGKCIARGLKVQVEQPYRKMPVRNRDNGWRMQHGPEPPVAVREIAKAACSACGYDFAAVDLAETEDGKIYVFECNRAPGLDDSSAAKYANAIKEVAK